MFTGLVVTLVSYGSFSSLVIIFAEPLVDSMVFPLDSMHHFGINETRDAGRALRAQQPLRLRKQIR